MLKKINNNIKTKIDTINDSFEENMSRQEQNVARFENIPQDLFEKADFERKQALEDRATEADVEFMLEENNKLVDGDYKEIDSGI